MKRCVVSGLLWSLLAVALPSCGGGAGTAPSSNATLVGLALSEGALTPAFDPEIPAYTVGPWVLPGSVILTATTADGGATLRIGGSPATSGLPSPPIALGMGATVVTVVVTAADGVTRATYTLAFDRTSADLADLVASAGSLDPLFAPGTFAYGVGPSLLPGSSTVTATALDPAATVRVNLVPTPSGVPSAPMVLPPGVTAASVEVAARDGTTTRTYDVVFDRSLVGAQVYLKASNAEADDDFGWSVAVSGNTVVVGAPAEASGATGVGGDEQDESAPDGGAAYVFVRDGAGFVQQAYLKASNTDAGDGFGSSVAISGDTIVVGAPGEGSGATGVDGDGADDSAAASGAAYVFVRSGTAWTQQAYLKASNTGSGDRFGGAVAVSADTVVVGAYFEDSDATGVGGDEQSGASLNSGAAYVFVRSGTTWSQEAYLKAINTDPGDQFGWSVGVSQDSIVVAAPNEDSGSSGVDGDPDDDSVTDSGAAYTFFRTGTTWTPEAYIKASAPDASDWFGRALALSDDTVVLGAYLEGSGATGVNGDPSNNLSPNSGAAFVFRRTGAAWAAEAYLKSSNSDVNDVFGRAVAIWKDAVLVGAPGERSDATGIDGDQDANSLINSGAAYLFLRTGSTWVQHAYLKSSNTAEQDLFGLAVAVSSGPLVVGAPQEDSAATGVDGDALDDSAPSAGAAYLVH